MNDCIFCKIIKGEIPSQTVYEDSDFIAFKDISPAYPVHILIVPRKHIDSVNDVTENDSPIFGQIFNAAKKIAKQFNIDETGYRLTVNTNKDAGQVVRHFHMHLMGGTKLNHL